MKAEDLINNNTLTNMEVVDGQTVVFTEIALAAVNMARIEEKDKASKAFCDRMTKESLECALSAKINMSCRDTCSMYKDFKN